MNADRKIDPTQTPIVPNADGDLMATPGGLLAYAGWVAYAPLEPGDDAKFRSLMRRVVAAVLQACIDGGLTVAQSEVFRSRAALHLSGDGELLRLASDCVSVLTHGQFNEALLNAGVGAKS